MMVCFCGLLWFLGGGEVCAGVCAGGGVRRRKEGCVEF